MGMGPVAAAKVSFGDLFRPASAGSGLEVKPT